MTTPRLPSSTNRFALVWVFVGLIAVAAAGLGISLLQEHLATRRVPTADPLSVTPSPFNPVTEESVAPAGFVGVVLVGESVKVEPKVEGRIQEVLVKAGDRLARGDVVARLDIRSLANDLRAQEASAAAAAARLRRRIPLSRGRLSAVTPEELENSRLEAVREKQRAIQLREAVAEGVMVAPFAGTVTERFLSEGAMAGPGRPVIRLLGHDKPRVRFAIPETRSHAVTPGMPIAVSLNSLEGRAMGVIVSVNPEIDSASRMVFAMAELAVPAALEQRLTNGVMVRVFPAPAAGVEVTRGR